jgi:hypothetical protein
MMRLRFWRTDGPNDDTLDPEVLSIFAASSHAPEADPAQLARGRARVAAALRQQPSGVNWFKRRAPWALLGGGGAWSAVIGAAAAHPAAAAAVGLGVLLAGGATVEVSGIGPAVREAVSPAHAPTEEPTALAAASPTGEAAVEGLEDNPGNGAQVTPAPEGAPGNLFVQVRPDGSFTLRGVLVEATDTTIDVQTAADDVPLHFELGDATIQVPSQGPATEPPTSLVGYDDPPHLVNATGECDTIDGALTEDCTLESVTVLGNAGQSGPPEGVGAPENPGQPEGTGPPEGVGPQANPTADPTGEAGGGPPGDVGPPDNSNAPENTGPPAEAGSAVSDGSAENAPSEEPGPPEDPGPPAGVPGQGQGASQ